MAYPYKVLIENMLQTLMAVSSSVEHQFSEIEGKEPCCVTPTDDGFLIGLLDHPLVKSGRIKITISNTTADEL